MTDSRPIPQDHLKPAAEREAEGTETIDIQWRGHTFTIPSSADDYPIAAVSAAEKGQNFTSLELILGPVQWAEFMKPKPLKRDGIDLFEAINKALGFDSGN